MRPGADPLEGLRRGVTEAAERMSLSPGARAGLRRRLSLDDTKEAAHALRCDLPAATTESTHEPRLLAAALLIAAEIGVVTALLVVRPTPAGAGEFSSSTLRQFFVCAQTNR
jgi:hypothetical protein